MALRVDVALTLTFSIDAKPSNTTVGGGNGRCFTGRKLPNFNIETGINPLLSRVTRSTQSCRALFWWLWTISEHPINIISSNSFWRSIREKFSGNQFSVFRSVFGRNARNERCIFKSSVETHCTGTVYDSITYRYRVDDRHQEEPSVERSVIENEINYLSRS